MHLENEIKKGNDFKEGLGILVSDGLVTGTDRLELNPYTDEKPYVKYYMVAYFRIHPNGVSYVQSRRTYFFTAVTFIILLIGAVSVNRCTDFSFIQNSASEPTEGVPAILEDSISDKTNILLDTVSGKATPIDSNNVVPEKIGDLRFNNYPYTNLQKKFLEST